MRVFAAVARTVHDLYFEPRYEEFWSHTIWSPPNAFTSAFKELEPIPQFKATAKLGEFLEGPRSLAPPCVLRSICNRNLGCSRNDTSVSKLKTSGIS